MTQSVKFSLGDNFPKLMHDFRLEFREDPIRIYTVLKECIPDVPSDVLDAFLKGKYDVGMENGSPFFYESGKDLTQEVINFIEQNYVNKGEDVELYHLGLKNVDEFVKFGDYNDGEEYRNNYNEHIETYTAYYEKAVKEFQKAEKSLNWIYRNWDLVNRQKPIVRSAKQIINAQKLNEHLCNVKIVDYHAAVMTKDGKIWWYGKDVEYQIFQHLNLKTLLISLGVDVESLIDYRPNFGWGLSIYNITPEQYESLISFAIERNEDFLQINDIKYTLEKILQFKNGEINLLA